MLQWFLARIKNCRQRFIANPANKQYRSSILHNQRNRPLQRTDSQVFQLHSLNDIYRKVELSCAIFNIAFV